MVTLVETLIDLVGFELVGCSKVWLSRVWESVTVGGPAWPRGGVS